MGAKYAPPPPRGWRVARRPWGCRVKGCEPAEADFFTDVRLGFMFLMLAKKVITISNENVE